MANKSIKEKLLIEKVLKEVLNNYYKNMVIIVIGSFTGKSSYFKDIDVYVCFKSFKEALFCHILSYILKYKIKRIISRIRETDISIGCIPLSRLMKPINLSQYEALYYGKPLMKCYDCLSSLYDIRKQVVHLPLIESVRILIVSILQFYKVLSEEDCYVQDSIFKHSYVKLISNCIIVLYILRGEDIPIEHIRRFREALRDGIVNDITKDNFDFYMKILSKIILVMMLITLGRITYNLHEKNVLKKITSNCVSSISSTSCMAVISYFLLRLIKMYYKLYKDTPYSVFRIIARVPYILAIGGFRRLIIRTLLLLRFPTEDIHLYKRFIYKFTKYALKALS